MPLRRSFAARLIVPVISAAALVIAAGLFLDYQLSRARILSDIENNARAAISAATTRIDEMTTGVESSVRLLGEALHSVPNPADIDALLRAVVDSNPHIFAAALAFDPARVPGDKGLASYVYHNGKALQQVDMTGAAKPYWEEPWFRNARDTGAGSWVDPYFETSGAQTLLTTFSVPIYRQGKGQAGTAGSRGEFLGVATTDLALAELHEYLEALRVDTAGFGFILTREGSLIGSPLGPVISAPIAEVFGTQSNLNWDAWLRQLPNGEQVVGVTCPRDQRQCKLRARAITGVPWYVGVVYSEEMFLRPLRDYETRVVTVGVTMLVLLAIMISLITRRLTRPLLVLAQASASIARGELGVPLPPADSRDEVGQLVSAFDSMRRDLGNYIEAVEIAATQRSRLAGQLSAARDIQMAMLPQGGKAALHCHPLELWARVRPAQEVGGDLYSFQRIGSQLLFAVGDVSDKGVPAALFMARAISVIQQWEVQSAAVPPELALRQLNEALTRDNDNCMFLTVVLGMLDLNSRQLWFASAGHSPPLLLRDGFAEALAQQRGPALGLQSGLDFPVNRVQLEPDDRLVIYTDGFDEARNEADQMLGEEALRVGIAATDTLPIGEAGDAIFAELDRFMGNAQQFDDMTLMLLELLGNRRQALQAEHVSLPINGDLIQNALQWLQQKWQAQGLAAEGLHDLMLVLEEITCNVRDHAKLPEGTSIGLSLERFADRVELECSDTGPAFNPLQEAERAELGAAMGDAKIGGLGVHLITKLTEQQFYRREQGHNILRVRLSLPAHGVDNAAHEED